ncbi:Lon protease family protein [Vibrio sp. S11_S32]|uniref:S16 family serine protease n=1 Tax=Vibrio sp. S11_S32 TaxID=2720225 RepID=UPI0016808CF0|nr:Lon protease family protein [Vibrio sp. S11_S32]MBD1575613.1 Lon protease family protein [Vibrio sp. S11_S32]
MIKEPWQSAIPNFSEYEDTLCLSSHDAVSFLTVQPRLKAAFNQFEQLNGFTRFLLINSPDNLVYRQYIQDSLIELQNDGHINKSAAIVCSESIEPEVLFGQYQVIDGKNTQQSAGLLQQANHGYLIISSNLILANPRIWPILKAAVLGYPCSPISSDPRQILNQEPSQTYDIKLVIVGDRMQLGDLDMFDADIRTQLCLFAEIEEDFKLEPDSFATYLSYVTGLAMSSNLPLPADSLAWKELLNEAARQTEDQQRMPLCPIWIKGMLASAAIESKQAPIEAIHIQQAIENKAYRQSYLPQRALDDILDGQVIIETQGQRIGQVNGLTVIEIPGHPVTYGEPARITCVIHFGDGDIADVERKAELGGNLHAKGMMIMQAFLGSALDLEEALPFAASIVFEQSYSEVDGDSASLAELCSLVSALSEYPINQQIAVTGAVDQFGRVQAVGGLNEKIEGFFHICQHQGFTGHQGVVLPKTNLKHLSLHKDVVQAIKNEQFHLWSVESVDEALPLIFGKAFRGDEDEDTILNKISERIENFDKPDHLPRGFLNKIKNIIGID